MDIHEEVVATEADANHEVMKLQQMLGRAPRRRGGGGGQVRISRLGPVRIVPTAASFASGKAAGSAAASRWAGEV